MEMKQYLIDTFRYNEWANKKQLEKIRELPDPAEAIKFASHLINCQHRWLARIQQDLNEPNMSWWTPVYEMDQLENEWTKAIDIWIKFLESKTEDEIFETVTYTGYDKGKWQAKISDIALQLNYHSIHHRAQVQTIIRQQGLKPEFLDYIGTKYKKL
jgi:uncharacterized damage-inducible protein DinB